VHFAAHAYVGESVTHPAKYYRNNLTHSLTLLDLVRKHRVGRFVFSSTCATYGIPHKLPLTEDHPQLPVNPYGNTKLAFEYALADYARAYGIGAVALRYFNASGAAEDGSHGEHHTPETHLIPLILQVALGQRSHVEVYGTDYPTPDGTCVRDYVHVEDLAEAHALAVEKPTPGVAQAFNIGTGLGSSVREVIQTCETVTGKTIAVKEVPRRAGDPPVLVASADKIRRELGWVPKYSALQSIVETAWRWHRTHPNGYA
jgi:UDP-glucose-4-epimerase GalE